MAGFAGKVSEVKYSRSEGRGSSSPNNWRRFARRAYSRAARNVARVALKSYQADPETFAPMGEDCDAHVEAWEAAGGDHWFCGFKDCSICGGDAGDYWPGEWDRDDEAAE